MNWLRRMQCRFNLCSGKIEHRKDANGIWWVGLECSNGNFHGPIRSKNQDPDALLRESAAVLAGNRKDSK